MWRKQTPGETCPDPFKDKVKCEECKSWIDLSDAQKVHVRSSGYFSFDHYYCPTHSKPYSRLIMWSYADIPTQYFKEVEVDKLGVPVGYTKIAPARCVGRPKGSKNKKYVTVP